jgi:cell division protein FtsB
MQWFLQAPGKEGPRGLHMSTVQTHRGLGGLVYLAFAGVLCTYFTFAAVQGDYGMFSRVAIDAEARTLADERDRLQTELAQMENLTHRLSDDYLDLDLLDQQARDVLGYMRADEIAIR